jgi:hypothetical protein
MSTLQPLIQSRILSLREQRVMLDADLAQLYGVETRALVQAVKRNLSRFPDDFMFQLTAEEWHALRSQTVISNVEGRGGRRTAPYAFIEQGVAMLSSVLGSQQAIAVNIEIMRTFVRVRAPSCACAHWRPRMATWPSAWSSSKRRPKRWPSITMFLAATPRPNSSRCLMLCVNS